MAEPVTSSASKEDFTFDYGDISIKVNLCGEGAIFGKVSSSALALASPVWKKFIFPPFPQLNGIEEIVELEGEVGAIGVTRTNFEAGTGRKDFGRVTKKQQQSWPVEELDFTDDEPDALLVLLRIAHLQFKDVPTSPSYEILLNLAILCDRYSCVALVRPWVHDWFANEEVESVRNNQGSWLNIAWVFGREKAFEAVAKKMVKELYLDGEPYSWAVDEYIMRPFPDGLLDSVLEIHEATIQKLLDIPFAHINRFEKTKGEVCKQGSDENECKSCDAVTYGSLIRRLQAAELWPRPKGEEGVILRNMSIDAIVSTLERLKIFRLNEPSPHAGRAAVTLGCYGLQHDRCFDVKEFQNSITAVASSIDSPVLDSHHQHLKAISPGGHRAQLPGSDPVAP